MSTGNLSGKTTCITKYVIYRCIRCCIFPGRFYCKTSNISCNIRMFYCRNNDVQCIQHMIDSNRVAKYTQTFSNGSCRTNIHISDISTCISGTGDCICAYIFIIICWRFICFQILRFLYSSVLQIRNITVAYLYTASVTDKSSGTSRIAIICIRFVRSNCKSVV